jgi:PAS domain S-box-containing protein
MVWHAFQRLGAAPRSGECDVASDGERRLLESLNGVVYRWNVARQRFVYISPQSMPLLGCRPQEMQQPGFWLSRIHPDDRARVERTLNGGGKRPLSTLEYRLIAASGDAKWLRDHIRAVEDGADIELLGVITDISAAKRVEAAIESSEQRYRMLLEKMDVVPYSFDLRDNRYIYLGAQAGRLLRVGLAAWSFEGIRFMNLHGDDRERVEAEWRSACNAGRSGELEYRILASGGDLLWIRDVFHFETEADGRTVAYGSLIDVTAKRQAEAALQDSQALLRSVIDAVPATISVKDLRGRYVLINEAFARFHDRPASWFPGRTANELYPADYIDRVEAREAEVIATGEPLPLYESARTLPDGRRSIWLASKAPLRDAAAQVKYVATVGVDVTEMKAAEEKLRESERRFRHLVESTDIVPYSWDLEARRYVYVGPQAETLLGFPAKMWLGEGFWLSQVHPEDQARAAEFSRGLHETRKSAIFEYRMLRKDGTPVWVRDIIDVDLQSDGRYHAYGVMIDVTQSKRQTEQLLQAQKMDSIGQMTGGVAHDFNNLLTVIIANLHLLMASAPADGATQRRLALINQAAERSASLTKRLLAFSRRQTLQPKTLDINALVSGMTELLRRTLGEAIEIRLNLAASLWQANVDPAQLESALVNLAVNARDAMSNAGKLDIATSNQVLRADEAKPDKPSGSFVMLSVADSGCGMTPEILAKVFEPFFTTKDVDKGTGLGLSMVYGFVKQSGGWVDIDSEVGKGTVVRLFLPRENRDGDREEASTATAPEHAPGGNETVLCVEDDPQVRSTVQELLAGLGYRVRAAENGPSALIQLHMDDDIDLLLTDVVMPGGMSGVVLAKEATRRRPALKVLFTSGYARGEIDRDALWLPKPYSPNELACKVREALGGARQAVGV